MHRRNEKFIQIFSRKNWTLARHALRLENNITIDLKEIGLQGSLAGLGSSGSYLIWIGGGLL